MARRGVICKSADDLAQMRLSCSIAACVRDAVAAAVAPGMTTGELAELAAEHIRAAGAESAFLGYRGYPGVICVSINDEVVHGIPGARRVAMGDIVSIDVGVRHGGFIGDTATTVMVGVVDPAVIRLVQTAWDALAAGIAQARSGGYLGDISHAIQSVAERGGYSVVRDFVGHGVGRDVHEEPQIPNFGRPGRGLRLRPGMTLALEPMLNMGVAGVKVDKDKWTVRTADGRLSAHVEHTVAITATGPEILTQ